MVLMLRKHQTKQAETKPIFLGTIPRNLFVHNKLDIVLTYLIRERNKTLNVER